MECLCIGRIILYHNRNVLGADYIRKRLYYTILDSMYWTNLKNGKILNNNGLKNCCKLTAS